MILSFQELKNEEHILNLVIYLNYFDYSQSVGRWVSGRWVGGLVVSGQWIGGLVNGGFNKTSCVILQLIKSQL